VIVFFLMTLRTTMQLQMSAVLKHGLIVDAVFMQERRLIEKRT